MTVKQSLRPGARRRPARWLRYLWLVSISIFGAALLVSMYVVIGTGIRNQQHVVADVIMVVSVIGLGILLFVKQRHQAELLKRQVTHQSDYLTSILQNSVDAILLIDNENRVLVWNRGAERIFGYTEREMLGQSFHRLVPPDIDAEGELSRIQDQVYRDGFIQNYQTQRLTKDGRRITVNLSRTLVRSDDGRPLGSTAIIKDITEKVEVDKQLYNTEKLASIGILAAGVAHEINNPLTVILGFTDLLKERFDDGSVERHDLMLIEENANNAKKIVENMLGFARVSEGQSEITHVNQALDSVLTIVRHTLSSSKIELITEEVRPELPPIACDPREFQQVIFNLVNNSISAMKDTGGRLSIAAWSEDNAVHVRISDTGIGIPDSHRERIFDPFFTTKKVGEGTGLGLSLSYGIVKKHGGDIRFTSRSPADYPEREGRTSFTVSMPLVGRNKHSGKEAPHAADRTGS